MEGGLVAHSLHEDRELNSAQPLFEDAAGIKVDPEMVQLAVQLIDRQTGRYDPSTIVRTGGTRERTLMLRNTELC